MPKNVTANDNKKVSKDSLNIIFIKKIIQKKDSDIIVNEFLY